MKETTCPCCSTLSKRHIRRKKTLIDLFGREITQFNTTYYCRNCCKHFTVKENKKSAKYTDRVYDYVVKHYDKDKTFDQYMADIFEDVGVHVPVSTIFDWVNE